MLKNRGTTDTGQPSLLVLMKCSGLSADTEHPREEQIWRGPFPGLRQRPLWRRYGCTLTKVCTEGALWNMPFGVPEEAAHGEMLHGGTYAEPPERVWETLHGCCQASDT